MDEELVKVLDDFFKSLISTSDWQLKPFDGVFRIEVSPSTTLEDCERISCYSQKIT